MSTIQCSCNASPAWPFPSFLRRLPNLSSSTADQSADSSLLPLGNSFWLSALHPSVKQRVLGAGLRAGGQLLGQRLLLTPPFTSPSKENLAGLICDSIVVTLCYHSINSGGRWKFPQHLFLCMLKKLKMSCTGSGGKQE